MRKSVSTQIRDIHLKVLLNLLLPMPQELVTNRISMDKNSDYGKLSITRCYPLYNVHLLS